MTEMENGGGPARRVESLLKQGDVTATDLREKYEEIYRESEVWLYQKSHGVHSVVYSLIKDLLPGSRVLDIGCGAGRLAIMCAHTAREVQAIDFSAAAIEIGELNATCAGTKVDFAVADVDSFHDNDVQEFDVTTMLGVLEHVEDPLSILKKINSLTRPNGTIIVSCPNFINQRGFSYMTLLTLLGLPMSLADLRQVDYMAMKDWCEKSGLTFEKTVGAIYKFGWGQKAAADMVKRVPLAVLDSGLEMAFNHSAYDQWIERMCRPTEEMLTWLESHGVLKHIHREIEICPTRKTGISDELWARITKYLSEDIESDPYYSDVAPFCYMGGEAIYILRKVPG